ncbi:AraC family transcriptional regulator [Nitratireductor basaltis]|uniref:Transcriptional regulator, AraC family n=1 Tax=Nitratireductor basaltis TaxID=472175 RepID=A0A084UAM7_9HYPH|nr:AraC family transcriptional regulator [Nitratireductor basaltis]KFB10013.1 Transcriptional regulator, AraC family [Nitratireductor basaltis]
MAEAQVADLLSEMLRRIRISGSLQYCFMPAGNWQTSAEPASYRPKGAVGFHIIAAGSCWLDVDGMHLELKQGDVVLFPFGSAHVVGAGHGGSVVDPARLLPPLPWDHTPLVRFGSGLGGRRLLCGYIECNALAFLPFAHTLPMVIHISTSGGSDWLADIVRQIIHEVDARPGAGMPVVERLSEIVLLEILRRELLRLPPGGKGWVAAVQDPVIRRCLSLIHSQPARNWNLQELARNSAVSRAVLMQRFAHLLSTSPIRYLRDWRLYLAAERLRSGDVSISELAVEAGYSGEAAFARAFARKQGCPPGTFRLRYAGADKLTAG